MTNEEIKKEVLHRVAVQKKKRQRILRVSASLGAVVLVSLAGVGLMNSGVFDQTPPVTDTVVKTTTAASTASTERENNTATAGKAETTAVTTVTTIAPTQTETTYPQTQASIKGPHYRPTTRPTQTTTTITLEEPPYYLTHFCDSYTELLKALTVPGSEGYDYVHGAMNVSATVHSVTKPFGNAYSNMLALLEAGKLEVLVPQRNGETMPLCDDGMIALLSVDLYGLPWIWYRSDVDDHIVRVQYTYVGAIDDPRLEQVTNIREFLSLIAPTAPSPTNYHNHPVYKRIYEQDLVLADGSSVLAWIYERKDSSQANVQYYKDGVVVWVYADEQLIADGLLSTFDLVPYSEAVG